MPLTRDRAKPAVPFGGHYRLIDFALSNLVNGGVRKIVVLTQYKSHSLNLHISLTWRMSTLLGNYVTSVPAQMRRGERWFLGSADAIFQNLNILSDERPDHVMVFGADHIYRMDPSQMLDQHIDSKAGVTVAGIRTPIAQASSFGIIERGATTKIDAFREKPADPKPLPDDPSMVLASMGNYIFETKFLDEIVHADWEAEDSKHDIGGNLIPMAVDAGQGHVYDFADNLVPGSLERDRGYWRDVGTIDSYFEAHMDLVDPEPVFNLYNDDWPVYTAGRTSAPAKIVAEMGKAGEVVDTILSNGVIVSGGSVRRSVLSPGVHIEGDAVVENSILLDGVRVGAAAVVRNAVIDKHVVVPVKAEIGVDPVRDGARFEVSTGGVVAIGKEDEIIEPR
jgi:glucose-1-phosphate adenylyltransferase